jgi:hypothetical protein
MGMEYGFWDSLTNIKVKHSVNGLVTSLLWKQLIPDQITIGKHFFGFKSHIGVNVQIVVVGGICWQPFGVAVLGIGSAEQSIKQSTKGTIKILFDTHPVFTKFPTSVVILTIMSISGDSLLKIGATWLPTSK